MGYINVNKKPRVTVTAESETRRNVMFHDNVTGRNMNDKQFVRSIERGWYDNYHVREINGKKTPVSNPNGKTSDNLG